MLGAGQPQIMPLVTESRFLHLKQCVLIIVSIKIGWNRFGSPCLKLLTFAMV